MTETLLVLGAGRSQVPAIRRAQELGLRVVAIDQNPEAPGFAEVDDAEPVDIMDVEGALAYAKEREVDGVLPTGDVSLPTAGAIADTIDLPGIDERTAEVATTKELYRERFADHGVPYPESSVVEIVDEAVAFASVCGYPVILKPSLSFGGSRGVVRADDEEDLRERFGHAGDAARDGVVLVERFYTGREHTIESIVVDGENHVLATSDKVRVTDPYCVATSLDYPSEEPEPLREEMREVAAAAARAVGLENSATHIEVVQTEDGLKVIDFGARGGGAGFIPARIVPHVSGVDMLEVMINIALGREPEQYEPVHRRGAVFRFFTPESGEVTAIDGAEAVQERDDVVHFSLPLSVGDDIPVLETQLDRSGSFVVYGEDGPDARRKAAEIEETVEIHTA